MPFRINCELCGDWVTAERRSKQYCAQCRPKAVFVMALVRNLNLAAERDPALMNELVNQRVEMDGPSRLFDFFQILEGQTALGVMTVLNLALKDYGMIAWDGIKFEMVRWIDRPGVVLVPDREVPAVPAGSFRQRTDRASAQPLSLSGRDVDTPRSGTFQPASRALGLAPTDHERIIGPRGPMIYRPSGDGGFDHVGYANPGGDEIFPEY